MMTKKLDFPRLAAICVCVCAFVLLLRFFAMPLFSAALPFLLSMVLVSVISPLAEKTAGLLRWKKEICAVLLFFLFLVFSLVLGGFALGALIRQGQSLLSGWIADLSSPSSLLSNAVDALRLPAGEESELFRAHFKAMLTDFAEQLFGELVAKLPGFAAKTISAIPSAILFAVVTVFSGVYFSVNGNKLWKRILSFLPKKRQPELEAKRKHASTLLQKYIRAYLVLFLLSFFVLLIGFWILNPKYAFFAALIIALVDLLPFLGVGTVLIPWAILELLCKNYYLGFGLLILCLIATLARQIAEPHLIGKTLGIHPLLSLAAGYAGWKLVGIGGLLLGPMLLPVLRWIFAFSKENGRKE